VSEYTAQEIATLQSRLDKQLGPEYISSRPGAGGQKVHYLAAEKVIGLANEVFGFNGWSSAIQNIQIDFVDEHPQSGKISLGLSVIVRVTLRDGTFHEDIGYGQIENCKGKAAAFEKAKKEGTTDALKRALRNFGNVLGNCIYDKNYLTKVIKVKAGAARWDVGALHRHPDFVTKREDEVKTAVASADDLHSLVNINDDTFDIADFDDAEFDETDIVERPDEVALPLEELNEKKRVSRQGEPPRAAMPPPTRNGWVLTTPSKPAETARPPYGGQNSANAAPRLPGPGHNGAGPPAAMFEHPHSAPDNQSSTASRGPPHSLQQAQNPPGPGSAPGQLMRPTGFYSARAAEHIDAENNPPPGPNSAPKFNPHADSPSIRKTAGVDHNKSIPLKRDLKPDTAGPPRDFIDPKTDQSRRLGIPGQTGQNPVPKGIGSSAYRPPTRRGPETNSGPVGGAGGGDRAWNAARRPPLVDVSNMQRSATGVTADEPEVKRQRINAPGSNALAPGPEDHIAGATG